MTPSLNDFIKSLENQDASANIKHAQHIVHEIPIYDGNTLRKLDSSARHQVSIEWAHCWQFGAGVIFISDFFEHNAPVEAMTVVLNQIIADEQQEEATSGDHFASNGANRRLWNALEKAAIRAPSTFIDYYRNPLLSLASQAWLGPNFQLTSQVNIVPPGGEAQQPHRDYHLGFQNDDEVLRYPVHVHTMSPFLTLQGAIAHTDMPVKSGPTKILPFSQRYDLGYLLYKEESFKKLFTERAVQLPLDIGDAVFFNPAIMHGAGTNSTKELHRIANLLQISSAFGKPMETVDHTKMQRACYSALRSANMDTYELDTVTTILSDCYPFPTNLDRDQPQSGLSSISGKQILNLALQEDWTTDQLNIALKELLWRQSRSSIA